MRRLRLLQSFALMALAGGCQAFCAGKREQTANVPAPSPAPPPARKIPVKRSYDVTGIVGTGQSLSVGANGAPVLSKQPLAGHFKLALGSLRAPPFDPNAPALSLVPLVEPIRPIVDHYPGPYPENIYGETPHSAFATELDALVRAADGGDYATAHSVVGESGQGMDVIDKAARDTGSTGRAYAATLFEVAAIHRLVAARGQRYGVGAVFLTHGETDSGNPEYQAELLRLIADYQRDIAGITGQKEKPLLFVSQQNSVPGPAGMRSHSPLAAWRAGVANPEDIVCTGPKYQYLYDSDGVHLVADGYRELGEKYAQIYFERVALGHDFRPLEPRGVVRKGRSVTVEFHVPVPPLVFSDTLPAPHHDGFKEWASGRGFELRAGEKRLRIASVRIAGNAVEITAAEELPAEGLVAGYAMTSGGRARKGGTVRWGQLSDSDPFVGAVTGRPQPNYAVAFELDVPG